MQFTVSNKHYLKNILNDAYRNYKDGTILHIEYEEVKQEKTLKQLAY